MLTCIMPVSTVTLSIMRLYMLISIMGHIITTLSITLHSITTQSIMTPSIMVADVRLNKLYGIICFLEVVDKTAVDELS